MRILHNIVLSFVTWVAKHKGEPLFKKWLELENQKKKIIESVQNGSIEFPQYLLEYLQMGTGINYKYYEQADWIKVIELFYIILSQSPKIELPITAPTDEKHKDEPWEYQNRIWHLYSHMLAKAYGWDLGIIAKLNVVTALAMIQEIITDEQLDREFQYGLSEMAYSYDKRTEKSRYNPMPRPHWMRAKIKPIERFLIPAYMLPVGNVDMKAIPDEYKPKEVIH